MKTLEPVLKRRYKALTRAEQQTRAQLRRLYKGHTAGVVACVRAIYDGATVNGATSHAALMRRIDGRDAVRLALRVRRLRGSVPDADTFPFNVARFDRLNKLDGARAELALMEYELAAEEYAVIMAHLRKQAEETWLAIEEWYDYMHLAAYTAANIDAILTDTQYPIRSTLYHDHAALADKTAKRIQEAIVRGDSPSTAARSIAQYVEGRERHNSDAVLFYEGTRTVTEAVREALGDNVTAYRSVTIHDAKACELCRAIEAEQAANPVPVDDFVAGINAPPFHPYCRCYIEVAEYDEDTQDAGPG